MPKEHWPHGTDTLNSQALRAGPSRSVAAMAASEYTPKSSPGLRDPLALVPKAMALGQMSRRLQVLLALRACSMAGGSWSI